MAETSCRQKGIAGQCHRRIGGRRTVLSPKRPSPKRLVTKQFHRRIGGRQNGVAESASPKRRHRTVLDRAHVSVSLHVYPEYLSVHVT